MPKIKNVRKSCSHCHYGQKRPEGMFCKKDRSYRCKIASIMGCREYKELYIDLLKEGD